MKFKVCVIILISFFLFSCSSRPIVMNDISEKIVTRIDTVKVVPPVIERLVYVSSKDSNVVTAKDTNIIIRYFPQEKRFYVKIKPDTVKLIKIHTDTIKKILKQKHYNANTEYIPYIFWGVFAVLVVLFIFEKIKNKERRWSLK
ncbi:MAG: hypothetical protein ACK4MM_03660 [Fervidobacterium sp.]